MGIRTPVAGVKGPHDWPDYTIAANCQMKWNLPALIIVDAVSLRAWILTVVPFRIPVLA